MHRPADGQLDIGPGFSHLAVQIDNLTATVEALNASGIDAWSNRASWRTRTGLKPHGSTNPDGYRIELVHWPRGHPDGITAVDFAQSAGL